MIFNSFAWKKDLDNEYFENPLYSSLLKNQKCVLDKNLFKSLCTISNTSNTYIVDCIIKSIETIRANYKNKLKTVINDDEICEEIANLAYPYEYVIQYFMYFTKDEIIKFIMKENVNL